MLNPNQRTLLLDSLRPPPGFRLDAAVGTTYSLDLTALLTAPLAFALFESEADDAEPDPLALLEAVRRHGAAMDVFCQAGRIQVPRQYQRVLTYLEDSIHEAVAPGGAMHAKAWVLRFTDPEDTRRYRLLCPSRNLTFDRSWDVLVSLDGTPAEEPDDQQQARNAPVASFLRALPGLARQPLTPQAQARIDGLADEVGDVTWEAPEGFHEVAFWTPGIPGLPWWPFDTHDRALVISPFLSAATVGGLARNGGEHVLISRPESLDELGAPVVGGYTETLVLADDAADTEAATPAAETVAEAEEPNPSAAAPANQEPQTNDEPAPVLTGLHAKTYFLEKDRRVRVLAGSANATTAAFAGNVEFLVELGAWRRHGGIDELLATQTGVTSFRDLLASYTPVAEPAEESADQRLEQALDAARAAVAGGRVRARYTATGDQWDLTLDGDLAEDPGAVTLRCWPITLHGRDAVEAAVADGAWHAEIAGVTSEAVTPFIACEVQATVEGKAGEVTFAVRAELEGGPQDRLDTVLTGLLRNHDDLLRLLALLLADGDADAASVADLVTAEPRRGAAGMLGLDGGPLFEALLRTLASDPERLDHIATLLEDLRRTEHGAALVPENLDAIWVPMWQVREQRRSGGPR